MKKKICVCGNDEFEATQVCRVNVIVDSENFFISNTEKSMEKSCYDSDKPYGDYTCTKCKAQYEYLSQLPKTRYYEKLFINEEINNKMQKLLDIDDEEYIKYISENKIKEDSTVFSNTITFDNKYQADIKVCTGQNNAFVDCVLFDDEGTEIACCVSETLLGEINFEYDNFIFDVYVNLDN